MQYLSSQETDRLESVYRTLEEREQAILQMLAVIHEPVARTPLLDCLRQAGVRAPSGKSLIHKTIEPYLASLIKKDLVQSQNTQLRCHPALAERITRRLVAAGRFEALVKAVHKAIPMETYWSGQYNLRSFSRAVREVRIALYRQKAEEMRQWLIRCGTQFPADYATHPPLLTICCNPFDPDWFATLSDDIAADILGMALQQALFRLDPVDHWLADLESRVTRLRDAPANAHSPARLRRLLAEQYLLRGRIPEAEALLEQVTPATDLLGWLAWLRDDNEAALTQYRSALDNQRKQIKKRKTFLLHWTGAGYVLALIQGDDRRQLEQAADHVAIAIDDGGYGWLETYHVLQVFLDLRLKGDDKGLKAYTQEMGRRRGESRLSDLFLAVVAYWTGEAKSQDLLGLLNRLHDRAGQNGYRWVASEAAELIARLDKARAALTAEHQDWRRAGRFVPLVGRVRRHEPWELSLEALRNLQEDTAQPRSETRLVWMLHWCGDSLEFEPKEQKRTAKGQWTAGRAVARRRLWRGELNCMTDQDKAICHTMEVTDAYYYGRTDYEFDYEKTLLSLVGHPLLFWADNPSVRVELLKGEPELRVQRSKQGLKLTLWPDSTGDDVVVIKETPTRLRVVAIKPMHRRMATVLGKGLSVPGRAEEQVRATIQRLSTTLTVQSDVGGVADDAEPVDADPRPYLHLLPFGAGLKAQLLTKPFGAEGPAMMPGSGGNTLIAEIAGRRVQTQRDRDEERRRAEAVLDRCPSLERGTDEDWEWLLDDPQTCLELLTETQQLGDEAVVAWPEGETLKVSRPLSLDQLKLNIRGQQDWFQAEGGLTLDDGQVLDMRRLLELLEAGPGRFLPLGEGQFLSLTRAFRKQLDEFRSYTDAHGKGVRFHPLAALALEDFTNQAGHLKTDKTWKQHLNRLRELDDIRPEPPSTLQAELRGYQQEGFGWLARLAHWGVGACLADDMGLGKTLQALALILTRGDGPTLVVAPTSVCANWALEARRFAPTLRVRDFSGSGRQQLLDDLAPLDLVICSYTLLQQDAEALAKVRWRTIVLDEAQAIKNPAAKRTKAALGLQGDFKLITTGTPIENRLSELWSLFRFINPGLLGSLDRFNERYATPIERHDDAQAQARLRKLIQPFILRRTKSQVLEELPARTETVLHVELDPEEMAFYEALRRQALDRLDNAGDLPVGQRQLQILAEITRLRRACCNPRLVLPEAPVGSSKLAVFGNVLEELLANRHKALVFSQFVDHLKIIRDWLDRRGITYQYLDGATPAADRQRRVTAFQAGEGDVFLISLKAGGTGLNLTAADYVIHMDPWWNPAVEDQASDRAHRIGQSRPVTVYRLVAQQTIEEKIVALHRQKRDLAEGLLAGSDISGRVSADELLRLIREG